MTWTITSLMWGLGWLMGTQELPFIEIAQLPTKHLVKPAQNKLPLRKWLGTIEGQINLGKGDGRLSKGEFLLARSMHKWRHLRRFETFLELATFVERSRKAGQCRRTQGKTCPPWERLPGYNPTLRGRTQEKQYRPRFHDSRNTRLCRQIASLRNVQTPSSAQRTRRVARLQKEQARLQRIIKFVKTLPKFNKKSRWVAWVNKQWRNPAYLARVRTALGFVPKKRLVLSLIKLVKVGQKPGPRDILRLARLVMRTPLGSTQLFSALSGWMIWGGDQRSRLVRWKKWRRFFRYAPRSCQSSQRKALSHSFFCGTTIDGAAEILSKSPFLNYFVRGIIKPFHGRTFDENLRCCLASRLGPWMAHGYGKRCIPKPKKDMLFRLLARSTMRRYEPFAPVRARALQSMALWRPKQAIPCLLKSLHPRREPTSYVRKAALRALLQVARRLPRQQGLIKKYLWRSANPRFEPKVHNTAISAGANLQEHRIIPHLLAKIMIKPHACRLSARRKYRGKYRAMATYKGIPKGYWSVLGDDLLVSKRSRQERRTMYQLIQCGDAPLGYTQRTIRFLQPKAEPDPALRVALWRSLLIRYLYLYHGIPPLRSIHPYKRRSYFYRLTQRTTGKSRRWLLLRMLLLSLEHIGLNPRVERHPKVQEAAMVVALVVRHPRAFQLFTKAAIARRFQVGPAARKVIFHGVRLWPYAHDHRLYRYKHQEPRLSYHRAQRHHFAYLSHTQQTHARAFFNRWRRKEPRAPIRKRIDALVKRTIGW